MRLTDLYYKMEYQYQHFLGQGQSNYKELIEILTDSSTHLAYLVFTSPLFFFHGFSTYYIAPTLGLLASQPCKLVRHNYLNPFSLPLLLLLS